MGRHSSDRQWPFIRSVLVWFLPWVIIAALVGAGVIFAVNTLSSDGLAPAAEETDDSDDKKRAKTPKPEATPTAEGTEDVEETPSPTPSATPTPDLITDGISVQVLNGTTSAGAADEMATRLEELGFTIAAVESAATNYERTTVFWSSDESQQAAEALAAQFGWLAEPQPGNLSTAVDVHVVVGSDEV